MPPHVRVAQGVIEGQQRTAFDGKKYYSFEGIPYAKPPLGKLRFRDPQPPDSWDGIRDCTKPGNKCAQVNVFSNKGFEGSEDCLYLNIYTPSLPAETLEKLPVLFFIHGGRITFGYADYYQPDYFIRYNVILVTVNYRLNILGFLSLDTPEVPGNAGLKDCAAALKWVNRNIESFNGDSDNVCLFGESAGGAICTAFLVSPIAEGLFHKMITQSGNVIGDVFLCMQDYVATASRIAANLGIKTNDKNKLLDLFESVGVEDLIYAYVGTENEKQLNPLLMPVVEKDLPGVERFIIEQPILSFQSNRFIKVPMINGSNSHEGAAFVFKDENGIHYEKDFGKFVPSYMYLDKSDAKFQKIAKELQRYYFEGQKVGDETKDVYVKFLSDSYFNRDITHFSELISKHNSQYYSFKFKYVGNLNIKTMSNLGVNGTTHGDAIQYPFYRKSHDKKADEKDKKIIDFFCEVFTNFAKNSKPTWSNQTVAWLPYTPEDKLTLLVDEEMSLVKNEDWDTYKFWDTLCGQKPKL